MIDLPIWVLQGAALVLILLGVWGGLVLLAWALRKWWNDAARRHWERIQEGYVARFGGKLLRERATGRVGFFSGVAFGSPPGWRTRWKVVSREPVIVLLCCPCCVRALQRGVLPSMVVPMLRSAAQVRERDLCAATADEAARFWREADKEGEDAH